MTEADESTLFPILWTPDGKHWHIAMQSNGKQAIATTFEKAETMLTKVTEFLRLKKHSTDGADIRIAKTITKPIKTKNIAG